MKRSLITLTLAALLSLTACSGQTTSKVTGDIALYAQKNYTSTYYSLRKNRGYTTEQYTRVYDEENGGSYFAINEVKAIAVAVDFTDYPGASTARGEEGFLEDMQTAIFDGGDHCYYYSLAQYYDLASFGNCTVSGTVVPEFYHTEMSTVEFANYGGKNTYATQSLCSDIHDWLSDTMGYDLSEYDANGDGFVDALIMVYTAPYDPSSYDGLYWAFCWSNNSAKASSTNPSVYRFFWASYQFFYEAGYYDEEGEHYDWTDDEIADGTATVDTHTLIHEFGHVIGAPDLYYNSSHKASYGNYDPMGCLDMMAYNIGDIDAYLKAIYGWTSPYVVSGNGTITINSTTDTGEFIVVPIYGSEFTTLLDQYLMIEYLTPTGVAKLDGDQNLYSQGVAYPSYFSKAGVRVTLVDSRVGVFTYSSSAQSYIFNGFTASVNDPGNQAYVDLACSNNNPTSSCFPSYKLIEIIPATGRSSQLYGTADNNSLYQKGDSFGVSGGVWENFMVDGTDGERDVALGIGFKITEMTDESVTIKFSVL